MADLDRAAACLAQASRVVVLSGAGVSAESGIATFRDAQTGLWARFDPQRLATPEAFLADPELVWGWYEWRRARLAQVSPNPAHQAIAELAGQVAQLQVVTQNVDDLHERAGSRSVIHLHGSIQQPRCFDCARPMAIPVAEVMENGQRLAPPRCPLCNGLARPGVVWFGESLPQQAWEAAWEAVSTCDLLLSVGTSGAVYPAAGLPRRALEQGARVIHVNPEPVSIHAPGELALTGKAGQLLPRLLAAAFG